MGEPKVVRMPLVTSRSLCATGKPCSGPIRSPEGQPAVRFARALHGLVGQQRHDRIDLRIHALDLVQMRTHHSLAGDRAFPDQPRQIGRGHKAEVVAHVCDVNR